MLNVEYWKEELARLRSERELFAVKNGVPCACDEIECKDCDFSRHPCGTKAIKWLYEEHGEPEIDWDNDIDWRRVPMDTEVLVKSYGSDDFSLARFAIYLPNALYKYRTFSSASSENVKREYADFTRPWEHCRLANPEDIEKYRKKV